MKAMCGVLLLAMCLVPDRGSASCQYGPVILAWPWEGMEDVPVQTALFGTLDGFGGEPDLAVELTDTSGTSVPVSVIIEPMHQPYYRWTATVDALLLPDTNYQYRVVRQDENDYSNDFVYSFRTTVETEALTSPAAPVVQYYGVGVNMPTADGEDCGNSITWGLSTLSMEFQAEGLETQTVWVEVSEAGGEVVFEAMRWGKYLTDGPVNVGHNPCGAWFLVDPCAQYCVRAAIMVIDGTRGPWSDVSCSDRVGYWECGHPEEQVAFGARIPTTRVLPQEVETCVDLDEMRGAVAMDGTQACSRISSTGSRSMSGLLLLAGVTLLCLLMATGRRCRRSPSSPTVHPPPSCLP